MAIEHSDLEALAAVLGYENSQDGKISSLTKVNCPKWLVLSWATHPNRITPPWEALIRQILDSGEVGEGEPLEPPDNPQ